MKTLKYSIIVSFMVLTVSLSAQESKSIKLYPGNDLILFSVGVEAVHSTSDFTGYTIQKQNDSESDYKRVATVEEVRTYKEFDSNVQKFLKKFPHISSDAGVDMQALFDYVRKGNSLQSLGSTGKNLLVKAGFGLMWWDEDVAEGRRYRYRVLDNNGVEIAESDWMLYSKHILVPQPEFQFNNYHELLKRLSIHMKLIHTYHVEKVEVRRKHFGDKDEEISTINQLQHLGDTINITVIDTLLEANRIYDYSFRITDLPGNISAWSPAISLVSFDYLQMPLPVKIRTSRDTMNLGVKIQWELENDALISKLDLYRSTNSVDGFELIATLYPGQREYSDPDLNASQAYFYYFESTYKMFDAPKRGVTFSAYYSEDYKPLPPELESVVANEKGIAIRWTSNDRNILGFRVYRALDGAEYYLVSDMIPFDIEKSYFEYLDLDQSLAGNKYYLYTVKAITTNLVESDYSDPMLVRPTINIPIPHRPIEPELSIDEGRILLYWNVDVEPDSDLLGYRIIRGNSNEPLSRDTFYTEVNMLIDTTALPGIEYFYTISESSVFGAISPESEKVKGKILQYAPSPPLSLNLGKTDNSVILSWELPSDGEYLKYNIYRYQRGAEPIKVADTEIGIDSFTDAKPLQTRNLVFYFVRAVDQYGLESENSNEVSVRWE